MNIKRAKQEIKDTIEAYFLKNEWGEYEIPAIRQRPVLLLGSPGIGKTQIMEQIAKECRIWAGGLYDHTPHQTECHRTSIYLKNIPLMAEEQAVTEYTMSEIVASIYEKIEKTGLTGGNPFYR